jgi:hypothetical protein
MIGSVTALTTEDRAWLAATTPGIKILTHDLDAAYAANDTGNTSLIESTLDTCDVDVKNIQRENDNHLVSADLQPTKDLLTKALQQYSIGIIDITIAIVYGDDSTTTKGWNEILMGGYYATESAASARDLSIAG